VQLPHPLLGDPMAVPFAFLAVTVVGALFALNAKRPFARDGGLSIGAFFAGWLTTELPIHHLAWQLAGTALFVWAGALGAWPGWIGLAIALISWVGLVRMFTSARQAGELVERALVDALGPSFRDRIDPTIRAALDEPQPLSELALPFVARDPRVERIGGLSYGPHGRRNQLDIRRLRGGKDKGCPVLVQVHGGAWVLGDKSQQGLPLVTQMASLGWVCVSINYRLSPRSTFPDHLIDVKRALAWVREHIEEYGGDPGFVVITGGSAGGHLAALAALTPNDPEYQPGFEGADTSVAACVPFYGVYDFTDRRGVGRRDMRRFLSRVVMKRRFEDAPELFDRASPMSRVGPQAPPFLVVHGTHDSLVPVAEARLFVDLLRAASKSPVAYAEMPGAQHAFEVFASARTAHVIRGVGRFLAYVHATRGAQAPRALGGQAGALAEGATPTASAVDQSA
jgi:acetyl esterase/lipase